MPVPAAAAFAAAVRAAMDEQGLTQSELSWRVGLTKSRIGAILRGRYAPTIETTVKLAEALGVDPTELDARLARFRVAP